jgi:hypothetical protein
MNPIPFAALEKMGSNWSLHSGAVSKPSMRQICKLLTSGERRISSARFIADCRRRPSAKRPSQFGGRDGADFGLADSQAAIVASRAI